jgi:excisionase family DNA binding protein
MPTSPPVAAHLRLADVCTALDVDERTVRKWIAAGLLGAIRIGPRLLRIPRADYERFLREQRVAP